ncbi:hypothetical protein ACOME3_008300 [Neoechinorhynchus agilis]
MQPSHHMHGSLIGHLVPSIYFVGFAIFWAFKFSCEYFQCQKLPQVGAKRFLSTTWTPCSSESRRRKYAITETLIKIFLLSIAIMGELRSMRKNQIKYKILNSTDAINFAPFNVQHVSMYSGFLFAAAIELVFLVAFSFHNELSRSIIYCLYIFAFFNEAFLFACHLHGRNPLDRFVHEVVVLAATLCGLGGIWELNDRGSILPILVRSFCVLLQGTWFCHVGVLIHASAKSTNANRSINEEAAKIMETAVAVTWHSIFDMLIVGCLFAMGKHRTLPRTASGIRLCPIGTELNDVDYMEVPALNNESSEKRVTASFSLLNENELSELRYADLGKGNPACPNQKTAKIFLDG